MPMRRQEHRDRRRTAEQQQVHARLRHGVPRDLLHAAHAEHRQIGIELGDERAHRLDQRGWLGCLA